MKNELRCGEISWSACSKLASEMKHKTKNDLSLVNHLQGRFQWQRKNTHRWTLLSRSTYKHIGFCCRSFRQNLARCVFQKAKQLTCFPPSRISHIPEETKSARHFASSQFYTPYWCEAKTRKSGAVLLVCKAPSSPRTLSIVWSPFSLFSWKGMFLVLLITPLVFMLEFPTNISLWKLGCVEVPPNVLWFLLAHVVRRFERTPRNRKSWGDLCVCHALVELCLSLPKLVPLWNFVFSLDEHQAIFAQKLCNGHTQRQNRCSKNSPM